MAEVKKDLAGRVQARHNIQYGMLEHGGNLAADFMVGARGIASAYGRGLGYLAQEIPGAGKGLASGLYHLPGDYFRGRSAILDDIAKLPGKIPLVGTKPVHGVESFFHGGQEARGFFARGAGGHLRMGSARMMQAYSPKFWPLELGLAGYFAFSETETQDLADPYNGLARRFAKNLGMTPGAIGGMAIGAAIGSVVPVIGPVVGLIAGTILGSEATGAMAEIPFRMAEKGRQMRLRRTMGGTFIDSQMAATSRQLAMQMIYESQMNARTAMGMEAMSYHG